MSKVFNYAAVIFSLLAFISVFIFVFKYSENTNPSDPDNNVYQFDWHAPLGAFGVLIALFIGGQAFHLLSGGQQFTQTVHAVFLTLGTVSMSICLAFMFQFHSTENIPDMYSVHAWVGLSFFFIFGAQLLVGIFSFLVPVLPGLLALPVNFIRSYHKAFGHAIIALGAAAICTGCFDRQRIGTDFFAAGDYDPFTRWGNAAAMLTFVAAMLTAFSLSFKPQSTWSPDDETKPLNPDL